MCFQIYGKSAQASKCVKSSIMNTVIDCALYIDTFEQQCLVIKGMLQSMCLKYHMKTIGIDQLLSNSAILNIYVFTTSRSYTNMLVSVTTNRDSKIFLWVPWFLLLKDSPITVLDIP